MSEVILQTIVEKLERLESLTASQHAVKDDTSLLLKIGGIEKKLHVYASGLNMNNDKLHQLTFRFDIINNKLDQRSSNTIHKHHLHKGVWISVALFIVCALLLALLINSCNKNAALKATDIKYRMLKLNAGKNLSKLLYHLDSFYIVNPDVFTKQTLHEEDILLERLKQLRRAGERKGRTEPNNIDARSYNFEHTSAPATESSTWTAVSSPRTNVTISNLISGHQYAFRSYGVGADPTKVYSDIITSYIL